MLASAYFTHDELYQEERGGQSYRRWPLQAIQQKAYSTNAKTDYSIQSKDPVTAMCSTYLSSSHLTAAIIYAYAPVEREKASDCWQMVSTTEWQTAWSSLGPCLYAAMPLQ